MEPLYSARNWGSTPAVALLLRGGSALDAPNEHGKVALHAAARHSQLAAARALVGGDARVGALATSPDGVGERRPRVPAHHHRQLCARGPFQGDTAAYHARHGRHGNGGFVTPLFVAAERGHAEMVAFFLGEGASADRASGGGETPLFVAARNGHSDVVAALLGAGADAGSMTCDGLVPLYLAARRGHAEVVRALLAADRAPDKIFRRARAMYAAARNGRVDLVAMLVAAGASPRIMTRDGITPLRTALRRDDAAIVAMLVHGTGALLPRTYDFLPDGRTTTFINSLFERSLAATVRISGTALEESHGAHAHAARAMGDARAPQPRRR